MREATPKSDHLYQVRQARRLVEKVHVRLLCPTIDAMDRGAAELTEAVTCLAGLDTALSAGRHEHLQPEVQRLRSELQDVQALLDGAGKLYAGWARLMAPDSAPANYTASGTAQVCPIERGRVVLDG